MQGKGPSADKILDSMIQFIEQHGNETVEKINKQQADEFTIQKNSYVEEKKEEITASLKTQLAN